MVGRGTRHRHGSRPGPRGHGPGTRDRTLRARHGRRDRRRARSRVAGGLPDGAEPCAALPRRTRVPHAPLAAPGGRRWPHDDRRPLRRRRDLAPHPRTWLRGGRHGGRGGGRGVRGRRRCLVGVPRHQRPARRAHRGPGRLRVEQARRLGRPCRPGQVPGARPPARPRRWPTSTGACRRRPASPPRRRSPTCREANRPRPPAAVRSVPPGGRSHGDRCRSPTPCGGSAVSPSHGSWTASG